MSLKRKGLKQVLAILLCLVVFAVPAMAATVTASQMEATVGTQNMDIKVLDVSKNDKLFKQISENNDRKIMKDGLLEAKYLDGNLIEVIDPSDNKKVNVVITPFIQDNKPGYLITATKEGQSLTETIQAISSDETTIDVKMSAVVNGKIVAETKKYKKETSKKLAEYFVKPAYADNHSLCVDLCNFLCSMGAGVIGCAAACTLVTGGTGVLLCPFICAAVVWFGCNYGCPSLCTSIGY